MRRVPSFCSLAASLALAPATALAQKVNAPSTLGSDQLIGPSLHSFWDYARPLWGVWFLFAAVLMLKKRLTRRPKNARPALFHIAEIDRMDGRTFERILETLFKRLGYAVTLTPYQGDWGGDLVIHRNGVGTVVQAKRYRSVVGVRAVQEVVAAKAKYGCTEAMVVTNSGYTPQAQELAHVNRVVLWDRQRLAQALRSVQQTLLPAALADHDLGLAPPSALSVAAMGACPSGDLCCLCGKRVSETVAAFCQSRPGRFGGRVYCFEHQKSATAQRERSIS